MVRQDSGGLTVGSTGSLGQTKRGTGYVLNLPAYENDVLNALARTGGLPGLDAENEVRIERGAVKDFDNKDAMMQQIDHTEFELITALADLEVKRDHHKARKQESEQTASGGDSQLARIKEEFSRDPEVVALKEE